MPWKVIKYCLPLMVIFNVCNAQLRHGVVVFSPVLVSFLLIPILELLLKPDNRNMDEAEEAMALKDPVYDYILYLIVPAQFVMVYLFLTNITQPGWLWWEVAGKVMALGMGCGVFGINVGHELGHRKPWYEQTMAKALLLTSLYTQFFIEHNKGHHKNVSTPEDPSSAPYGCSLYSFWFRSIRGVYLGAWRIAGDELRKKGLPRLHWRNEMLQLQLLTAGWLLLIGLVFGVKALLLYLPAAAMGILLLETVNYIEHYGLARKRTERGTYERTRPMHSWNSNHPLGRIVLFELSRHSDHHYLASRPYQILRHHEEAPQLPTGYPGSMLLATIPPIWFRVMDKQLKQYGMQPA